jgi:hypothetical protein
MSHHTKDKGDIAAAIVIADLTIKGYTCFTPIVSEHLPFDIIAYKDNKCLRIQAKYSSSGNIPSRTSWSDHNGSHVKYYSDNDFDYYAIYSPQLNKIMYPSIKYRGKTISYIVPNNGQLFNWYEDFLNFTEENLKKTYKDFGTTITHKETDATKLYHIKSRKVIRPTKEELEKLLWEKPITEIAKDYNVSDVTIHQWSKQYELNKPPKGHWIKKK